MAVDSSSTQGTTSFTDCRLRSCWRASAMAALAVIGPHGGLEGLPASAAAHPCASGAEAVVRLKEAVGCGQGKIAQPANP